MFLMEEKISILNEKKKRFNIKSMNSTGSKLEPKKHQFTYSEITNITNNFEKVIGKGGFGPVYYGYVDTQVAIKIFYDA